MAPRPRTRRFELRSALGTRSITNDSGPNTCQADAFAAAQGGLGWTGTLVNTGC